MKVILKDDLTNLGKAGSVVNVADGYARNCLIPKCLAVEANIKNIKALEHEKRKIDEKARKIREADQEFAKKISALTITLKAKAGEEDKLFGSITAMDITDALKARGIDIDRRKITLEEPIKRLGAHTVSVKIKPEITASLNINVIAE